MSNPILLRIPEKINCYANASNIMERISSRDQLAQAIKLITEIKKSEDSLLLKEIDNANKNKSDIKNYSNTFKENLKLILSTIIDEVYAEDYTASSDVCTAVSIPVPLKNIPDNKGLKNEEKKEHIDVTPIIKREISEDPDHCRPYSLSPERKNENVTKIDNIPETNEENLEESIKKSNEQIDHNTIHAKTIDERSNLEAKTEAKSPLPFKPITARIKILEEEEKMKRKKSPFRGSFSGNKSLSEFKTVREKTEFYNNLVQSEFCSIVGPGTFKKAARKGNFEGTDSPGPAYYHTFNSVPTNKQKAIQQNRSPGGYIPRDKRKYLINERESAQSPGPHEYYPKYRFVAKN